MASNRPEKVGEQIRIELTQLIAREVHDPGIGFLTLTKVKVTSDLQIARVYYTSYGDAKAQSETGKALARAAPFLRRQIGQRVRLRRVPELEFFYDASIAQHDRIEQILQELKAEADARGDGAAATEPGERSGASDEARAERSEPGGVQGSPPTRNERSGDREVPASERAGGSGGAKPPGQGDGAAATEPRERSGDRGVPASERAGGSGGAKPPGLKHDDTKD
jgi:ribosome-binding factor A